MLPHWKTAKYLKPYKANCVEKKKIQETWKMWHDILVQDGLQCAALNRATIPLALDLLLAKKQISR